MRTIQREILARTIILAVAIFATDGFAWGQESPQVAAAPPPETAANPAENATTPGPVPTEATPTALGSVDQTFLQKAAELHATGVALAKLTETNAGTEEVQALGQELLAEHTRSIAALREIARSKSFELTASPTATQQATVSEFAGKVGQSFDETYRAQAMSNHEQAILVFAEAAKTAKDSDVRNFAERSLGDMKDRHASMGGEAVKLKGEIALKLQKTTKAPAAATATAKTGKGAKSSKTKTTAAAAKAAAGQTGSPAGTQPQPAPLAPTPAGMAETGGAAVASTAPAVSEPAVTPQTRNTTATTNGAATRINPAKVTAALTDEDYTERESDVKVYDPRAPAARRGQTSASRTRDAGLEPLIVGEPSEVAPKPVSSATTARSTEARAQSSVPADAPAEGTARTSRTRSNSRPARMTTSQETSADSEVSVAPVARVVVQPRRTSRTATVEVAPPESAPRVIIQQAPPRRTFRIFSGEDNDD